MAVQLSRADGISVRRSALLSERSRLIGEAAALASRERSCGEAQRFDGGRGGDDADIATEAFEQELASELARNVWVALVDIDAALARMESGEYGVCEDCGAEINPDRLRALPRARRCLTCQQQAEFKARRHAA